MCKGNKKWQSSLTCPKTGSVSIRPQFSCPGHIHSFVHIHNRYLCILFGAWAHQCDSVIAGCRSCCTLPLSCHHAKERVVNKLPDFDETHFGRLSVSIFSPGNAREKQRYLTDEATQPTCRRGRYDGKKAFPIGETIPPCDLKNHDEDIKYR